MYMYSTIRTYPTALILKFSLSNSKISTSYKTVENKIILVKIINCFNLQPRILLTVLIQCGENTENAVSVWNLMHFC